MSLEGPGTHVDGEVWAARESGDVVGSVQLIELAPRLTLVDVAVVGGNTARLQFFLRRSTVSP